MWVMYLLVAVLGLLFGSFGTALAYRLPRGESFTIERSRCTHCDHTLGVLDLFPLFSWLVLRGKCRHCGTPYGSSYVLLEAAMAVLFVLAFHLHYADHLVLILWPVLFCLLVIIVSDARDKMIPNSLLIVLLVLAIPYHLIQETGWISPLLGGLVGLIAGMALRMTGRMLKKSALLGMGDVKLLTVAGIYVMHTGLAAFLLCVGMAGIACVLFVHKRRNLAYGAILAAILVPCLLWPGIIHELNDIFLNFSLSFQR